MPGVAIWCRFLCALSLALGFSACSLWHGGSDDAADASGAFDEPIVLHVENNNFYDATIYALWGAERERLGIVGGNRSETFRTRWNNADFRVGIDLLASTTCRTEPIMVSPGDELHLTIRPDLHRQSDVVCR